MNINKWNNKKTLLILFITTTLFQQYLSKRCSNYGGDFYITDHESPFTKTGLTCGKSNPKKQEDCTKYGTDSGMYCCWVAKDENDNNGKCYLVSQKKVERSGIDGCAQFIGSYWSCGNNSSNLRINKKFLFIIIGFVLFL